jgi:DNA-directed primase/polymerase protein
MMPTQFWQQSAAIDHMRGVARTNPDQWSEEDLIVYGEEKDASGRRSFWVDSFEGFASKACSTSVASKHYYEVLVESRPCWLYFDLEYNRTANAWAEPDAVAEAFKEMLLQFCQERLQAPLDPETILEMDSTTEVKFSRHIIVRSIALESTARAGEWVSLYVQYLREAFRKSPSGVASKLFFWNACGTGPQSENSHIQPQLIDIANKQLTTSLIDQCVYSRNRNFRVLSGSVSRISSIGDPHGPHLIPIWPHVEWAQILSSHASN